LANGTAVCGLRFTEKKLTSCDSLPIIFMFLAFREWLEEGFEPEMVQWVSPNIMEERGEIVRQAKELNIDWRQLMEAFKQARLVTLTDEMWANMQNTDSNDPNLTLQKLMSWTHRNVNRILGVFKTGGILPAPIVLIYRQTPVCVAGNTRLSACKVLGVRPKVLMVQL
jgi:hypothetical protein